MWLEVIGSVSFALLALAIVLKVRQMPRRRDGAAVDPDECGTCRKALPEGCSTEFQGNADCALTYGVEACETPSGTPWSRWRAVTTSPGCWHVARNLEKGLEYLNPDAPPMSFADAQRAAAEANRAHGVKEADRG